MDPNAAWQEIAAAIEADDCHRAAELAEDLLGWLNRKGFPPKVTGNVAFDRIVVHATCSRLVTGK
jgi:hypothetical protein